MPSGRHSAKFDFIFKKKLFDEYHGHGTRQSWKNGRSTMVLGKEYFLKKIQTLPSAGQRALGKEFFLKKNSNFAERRSGGTRQRIFRKKN